MSEIDPISQSVAGVRELIGSKVNKIQEGVASDLEGAGKDIVDELTLDLSDEALLALKGKWERKYAPYEAKILERQNANKKYYLGRQLEGTQYNVEFPIAANLLFEAEETFLPAALSQNPEPVVWSDNTPAGTDLSSDVKTLLQYHADTLELRGLLTLMTRHWSIYYLGIIKHGWDKETNDIKSEARNPQNFIFDPTGCVNVHGEMDSYVGERITVSASELIDLFPKHTAYITTLVQGEVGTEVTYTEWWTDEYCFYTLKDVVLDKHKNQFFNYSKEQDKEAEDGEEITESDEVKNHFATPKKPYTFLSIFSLAEQPHDITGLIEQNIPNQNLITKRTMQIDVNLSRQNNSVAFSAENFNQQTAKQAAQAFEKGNPVLIPSGRPVAEAIVRFPAEAYPQAAFEELAANKENLRSSFGTQGIAATKQTEDTTARGMILNQQRDSTRIGGGIGDRLEAVAKNVFNYWTQLYYVFYDEQHLAAIMGMSKSVEYATISNEDFDRKLVISVAPDSMTPKDELTIANQALQLWATEPKGIDLKTLLITLNFPNPVETAGQAWLYMTNPQLYGQMNFPDLFQEITQFMQTQQQQLQPHPGVPPQGGQPVQPIQPTPEPTQAEAPNAQLSQVPLPQ